MYNSTALISGQYNAFFICAYKSSFPLMLMMTHFQYIWALFSPRDQLVLPTATESRTFPLLCEDTPLQCQMWPHTKLHVRPLPWL